MRIVGGKQKLAKRINAVVTRGRKEGQTYDEPFLGAGSTFMLARNPRIGGDGNLFLMAMLAAVRDGWTPPEKCLSKKEWLEVKELALTCKAGWFPPLEQFIVRGRGFAISPLVAEGLPLMGFCAHSVSFGARFFDSYFGNKIRGDRDYWKEACNALKRQAPMLKGAEIYRSDYKQLYFPQRSIIYCDPPYSDFYYNKYYKRSQCGQSPTFSHSEFLDWACEQKQAGHEVYVSAYEINDPRFEMVASFEGRNVNLNINQTKRVVEKIFAVRDA